jgi:hypothetical protein
MEEYARTRSRSSMSTLEIPSLLYPPPGRGGGRHLRSEKPGSQPSHLDTQHAGARSALVSLFFCWLMRINLAAGRFVRW